MRLRKQLLTRNQCYITGQALKPQGVMIHSTGANNARVARYVPGDNEMGRNTGGNHWNRPGVEKCVHAFVGKFADGQVGTVQTLPWYYRGWHCAGKGNNTHIGFEICEDGLSDPAYFRAVYQEAAELTAYLCKEYHLDPLADGVVICHKEGYLRGIASNHADVLHWFPKHGKTMDDFRADVARMMEGDANMTDVKQLTSCAGTGDTPSDWAREATDFCKRAGIFNGDGEGNYGWQQPITREAVAQIIYNVLGNTGMLGKF